MSKTDYLENELLDHVMLGNAYSAPATLYLGLFTAAPGELGGGTEVSGNNYARQAITFAAASGGSSASNADISFPVATASWGSVTHFGIFDAVTAGNLLYYGTLTVARTVGTRKRAIFTAGEIIIKED